jgi:hypothetical protein
MKPLALYLTLFAVFAAGCGRAESLGTDTSRPEPPAAPQGSPVEASCVAGFSWNGRFYARDAGELDGPVELGAPLGQGVEPGCNDTGEELVPDSDVTVFRIKGVNPETAVARLGDDRPYFNVKPAP